MIELFVGVGTILVCLRVFLVVYDAYRATPSGWQYEKDWKLEADKAWSKRATPHTSPS
jgi:hypothetical protein